MPFDGGATQVGIESTIVACLDGTAYLLRPGGLPRSEIEAVLGFGLDPAPQDGTKPAPRAPGMLASHYAPKNPLRLEARTVEAGEVAARRAASAAAAGIAVRKFARILSLLRSELRSPSDTSKLMIPVSLLNP